MDPVSGHYLLQEDDIAGALQAVRGARFSAGVHHVLGTPIRETKKRAVQGTTATSSSTAAEAMNVVSVNAARAALDSWTVRLQALKEYKAAHGNYNIPTSSELGKWVKSQRNQYRQFKRGKKSRLSEEQMNALDELDIFSGIDSSPIDHDEQCFIRYEQLIEYKLDNGDCNVPNKYAENTKLGYWTHRQRVQYRLYADGKFSRLTEERFKFLENIGLISIYEKQVAVQDTVSSRSNLLQSEEVEEEVPEWEMEW